MQDKENKYKKGMQAAYACLMDKYLQTGMDKELIKLLMTDESLLKKVYTLQRMEETIIDIVLGKETKGGVEYVLELKQRILNDVVGGHAAHEIAQRAVGEKFDMDEACRNVDPTKN